MDKNLRQASGDQKGLEGNLKGSWKESYLFHYHPYHTVMMQMVQGSSYQIIFFISLQTQLHVKTMKPSCNLTENSLTKKVIGYFIPTAMAFISVLSSKNSAQKC